MSAQRMFKKISSKKMKARKMPDDKFPRANKNCVFPEFSSGRTQLISAENYARLFAGFLVFLLLLSFYNFFYYIAVVQKVANRLVVMNSCDYVCEQSGNISADVPFL